MLYIELPSEFHLGTVFIVKDTTVLIATSNLPPPDVVALFATYKVHNYTWQGPIECAGYGVYLIACELDQVYEGPREVKTHRIGMRLPNARYEQHEQGIDIWQSQLPHIPTGNLRICLGQDAPFDFYCLEVVRLTYDHYVLRGNTE